MITRRGVGLLLTAIAVFFVASATRVGWLHLADAVLWGLLALSLIFPWAAVSGVRATRRIGVRRGGRRSVTPVEGDTVDVDVSLENPGAWPRYLLSGSYDSTLEAGDGQRHRFFFAMLPRRARITATRRVEVRRRGRHFLGSLTLECSGPFGMFRRRKRFEAPSNLLVYPRWVPMGRVGLLDLTQGVADGHNRSRAGGEIAGSRRYVFGDPMRQMHWRNSARTGRPAVKEFDARTDNAVVLALDVGMVRGKPGETTLDYGARIAASVSRAITGAGGDVSLMTGSATGAPTTNWAGMMRSLAMLEPSPDRSLGNALRQLVPGTRLLAAVWARDGVSVAALSALARRGCTVTAVVLDGFEPGDDGAQAVGMLRNAGIAAVSCHRGALEDAIAAIERAGASDHSGARHVRTAGVRADEVLAA